MPRKNPLLVLPPLIATGTVLGFVLVPLLSKGNPFDSVVKLAAGAASTFVWSLILWWAFHHLAFQLASFFRRPGHSAEPGRDAKSLSPLSCPVPPSEGVDVVSPTREREVTAPRLRVGLTESGERAEGTEPSGQCIRFAVLYTTCDDFQYHCCASCLQQNYPAESFRFLICDDSKQAHYREEIDRFAREFPQARIVRRKDRKGFKAGNLNHAIRNEVQEDWIVVLDADQILPADYLSTLASAVRCQPPQVAFVQAAHQPDYMYKGAKEGGRKLLLEQPPHPQTLSQGEKGVGTLLGEAPSGPFRQKSPGPFFAPAEERGGSDSVFAKPLSPAAAERSWGEGAGMTATFPFTSNPSPSQGEREDSLQTGSEESKRCAQKESEPLAVRGSPFQEAMGLEMLTFYERELSWRQRCGFVPLLGHGAAIRREAFDAVGGFPEIVSEDYAFTLAATAAGRPGVYAGGIRSWEAYPKDFGAFLVRLCKFAGGTAELFRSRVLFRFFMSRKASFVEKIDFLNLLLWYPLLPFTVVNAFLSGYLCHQMWHRKDLVVRPTALTYLYVTMLLVTIMTIASVSRRRLHAARYWFWACAVHIAGVPIAACEFVLHLVTAPTFKRTPKGKEPSPTYPIASVLMVLLGLAALGLSGYWWSPFSPGLAAQGLAWASFPLYLRLNDRTIWGLLGRFLIWLPGCLWFFTLYTMWNWDVAFR